MFGNLSAHGNSVSRRWTMKVRCDRDYASFLKSCYRNKFFVDWQNGIMTVTKPMINLACLCEE